jgi:WD40 repeat protein
VSGSADHTIRVWDSQTAKCLRVMREHDDSVTDIDVSGDSERVASASMDKVRLQKLGPEHFTQHPTHWGPYRTHTLRSISLCLLHSRCVPHGVSLPPFTTHEPHPSDVSDLGAPHGGVQAQP